MNAIQTERVQDAASTASSIACLCQLIGEALAANPDTAVAAEAIDGLGELATSLSVDLNKLASGEAS